MEKKNQHVIPECYLKAWCDPNTPMGQTSYVWVHSRDGLMAKKRAPRKLFTETDFYTVKLGDGSRSLVIENSFSVIEDRFARLRNSKLKEFAKLSDEERALLCVFTAMMSTRTKSQRANWTDFYSRLHDQVESMERFHNAEPSTSLETAHLKEYGHHMFMGHSIDFITEWLFRMNMVIFTAVQHERFITSDHPCVWFNPEAHKFPPLLRSPGLAQDRIEITLPLSPTHFVVFSWTRWNEKMSLSQDQIDKVGDCVPIVGPIVSEMNRRTRGYCDEFFVTHSQEIDPKWLDPGEEPEESWDKMHGHRTELAEQKQ
jgi:Protein of unknown function (DUF4238)